MTPASPGPTPRNYWPYALIAFFVLFTGWTAGFIVFSLFHREELVSPDYYQQELRYQEQMDREARARSVAGGVEIAYEANQQAIVLRLPDRPASRSPAGTVHLYRPSAAELDRQVPLELDDDGQQTIDARSLAKGLWRVQVTWSEGGETFFHKQDVVIGGAN